MYLAGKQEYFVQIVSALVDLAGAGKIPLVAYFTEELPSWG